MFNSLTTPAQDIETQFEAISTSNDMMGGALVQFAKTGQQLYTQLGYYPEKLEMN